MNNSIDRSVLDNLPTAILICNSTGTIDYVNNKFIEIFGYTKTELTSIRDWWLKDEFNIEPSEIDSTWSSLMNELNSESSNAIKKEYRLNLFNSKKSIEIKYKKLDSLIFIQTTPLQNNIDSKSELENIQSLTAIINDTIPGIFYVYDENGYLINFNKRHATAFGYTPEEIKNRHMLDWFDESEHELISTTTKKLYNGEIANAEVNILNKDGFSTPYLCTGHPFEHNGKMLFCGVGIDITDKNKALADKEEFENKYKTLINAFPDIILVSDLDGKLLYTNPALKKQTGLDHIDLQGNGRNKYIYPDDAPIVRQKIYELLESDNSHSGIIENRFMDKFGKLHWYSSVVTKINFRGKPAIQIIARDITKSKEAESALVESEERMSSIFDNASVAMLLLNNKREVLQINKKGLESLKKSKEDSVKHAFGAIYNCITSFNSTNGCGSGELCNHCLIKSTVEDTYLTGKPHYRVEATVNTMEGRKIFQLSTNLLKLKDRREVLTSIDDITERKSIELQLKQAKEQAEESDRLKTAFLQNMSHEIRTPLNGILGFSGLLNNQDISDEEKGYYLNVINESSNQLLSIVDNILSLSRLETEKLEVVTQEININDVIGELFFKYNTKVSDKNIYIQTHKSLNHKESAVYSDSAKIQLILQNLLDNAIKFTHEGHIRFGYNIKDENIEFFVEDTGIGIDKIYFDKIFERFQQVDDEMTRKYGGTGLGLTIAKGNVEIIGGKIWLESTLGKGSSFYFTVPFNPVYDTISTKAPEEDITVNTDDLPVILVAEDEEINYMFIEEALKDLKIKLIHAHDGREAVNFCKENPNIRLVLMDIKMPNLDGYMALSQIKAINPELPIVAQTAYAFFADKQKALDSGFIDYISKPIKKEKLIEIVNKYSRQKE